MRFQDLKSKFMSSHWRPAMRLILLVVLYFLAAAASFNGFYEKWGFREGFRWISFSAMVDGSANRPFVYRQLGPILANSLDRIVSKPIHDKLTPIIIRPSSGNPSVTIMRLRRGESDKPVYALRYIFLYYICFCTLFFSLFFMRAFCRHLGASKTAATAAPVVFALTLPVLLAEGGYFYDMIEVFFFAAAFYISVRNNRWWLILLTVPASLNKESFLFFLITLAPFVIHNRRDWRGVIILCNSIVISGLVYLLNKARFAQNAGGSVDFHLFENLKFYINPVSLFRVDRTYGLIMFAGYSLISLVLISILICIGAQRFNFRLRLYAATAICINMPLYFLFAAPGETRNLSFLYPMLVLLIAGTIDGVNTTNGLNWEKIDRFTE